MTLNFPKRLVINGTEWNKHPLTFDVCTINGGKVEPTWQDIILHGNTALTLVNAKAGSLEYLSLFGGTELLPETYLDTVTLSGGCEQRNLPSGYTQVEYLEGDGNAYINTGLMANADFEIKGKLKINSLSSSFSAVCGAHGVSRYVGVLSNGYWTSGGSTGITATLNTWTDFDFISSTTTGATTYINNTLACTRTDAGGISQNYISLFGYFSNIALSITNCSFKVTEVYFDGALARKLVPCRRNSDNVLGMYDTVSQTFFTNAGTGSFTAGADVTTPSPSQPIDIISNNGALKVSKNLFNNGTLYNWFFTDGVITYKDGRYAKYMSISSSETYTISRNDNYDVPLRIVQTEITPDAGVSYKIDGTTTFVSIASNQFPFTFTSRGSAKFLVLSTDSSLTEAQSIDLFNKLQVELGSTATTYMPYGQIYTQGTVETVTDSSVLTANAERLLAVGNYKDTQEVISGAVTKNIGIKVFDGTEEWTYGPTYTRFYISIADIKEISDIRALVMLSTHYSCISDGRQISEVPNNSFYNGSNETIVYFKTTDYTTVSAWKQFLADQYAQGTPVIVVYPTSSATTSSVTGQFLSKSPVTQTAGSISNLPIAITESQKTVPTPQQPLPINCNNGVLGIDSQGNITVTGTTETVEITGKNLLDTTSIITGSRLNITLGLTYGEKTASAEDFITDTSYYVSNLIPVEVGKTYIKNSPSADAYHRFKVYDTSKVAIRVSSGNSITIQSGEAYIAFCGLQTELTTAYCGGLLGTATAEMLLAVGNYQDVQSVIDGGVTRNVGIKVLDGTEDWAKSGNYAGAFYFTYSTSYNPVQFVQGVCTHARWVDSNSFTRNTCYNGSAAFIIWNSNFNASSTVDEWKQWLATQYNAGTPVIIVYPLATPTTETVTAQPMNIQAGTNIVQITQASMDDLELEVKYKAGVSVTITEIENAQLSNSVTVTIS